MPKTYTIEISDENDAKLRAQFPNPDELFQKVVADAIQAEDLKLAEAAKPEVVRVDPSAITVSVE